MMPISLMEVLDDLCFSNKNCVDVDKTFLLFPKINLKIMIMLLSGSSGCFIV